MENLNNFGDISAEEIQFAVAESYKTIRTNLLFLLSSSAGCKSLTVSSPRAGDGKSTNAINISIAFSQLGKRVLLIDADLRRPSIHKKLRIANTEGLSGILAGFCDSQNAIVNISPCFDVLPSGAVPPNPSELLASPAYENMLSTLRLAYDIIIIDTPPIGVVSDALSIASKTDGLLLVVKEKVTVHTDMERILDNLKLSNVRILGAVLNSAVTEENYTHYKSTYY